MMENKEEIRTTETRVSDAVEGSAWWISDTVNSSHPSNMNNSATNSSNVALSHTTETIQRIAAGAAVRDPAALARGYASQAAQKLVRSVHNLRRNLRTLSEWLPQAWQQIHNASINTTGGEGTVNETGENNDALAQTTTSSNDLGALSVFIDTWTSEKTLWPVTLPVLPPRTEPIQFACAFASEAAEHAQARRQKDQEVATQSKKKKKK